MRVRVFIWFSALSMESGPLHTVDGRHPAHQLRLVAYPSIDRVLYIPGGAGFLSSTVCQNDNSGQKTQTTFLRPPDVLQKVAVSCCCKTSYHPYRPKNRRKRLESSRSEVLKSDRIRPSRKRIKKGDIHRKNSRSRIGNYRVHHERLTWNLRMQAA